MQHKPEIIAYQLTNKAAQFASNNDYHAFKLDNDGLVFFDKDNHTLKIDFLSIERDVAIEAGWFWDTLVIQQANGETFRFGGVNKESAKPLQSQLNNVIHQHIRQFNQQIEPALNQAVLDAKVLFAGQRYIRRQVAQHWQVSHRNLVIGLKRHDSRRLLTANAAQQLKYIQPLLDGGEQAIQHFNERIIERETQRYKGFFDQIESHPLTESQRQACVIDERHNLVLAGAGTGKTSTMIGRAGYLLKASLAKPEQILMLAYARKAADEMDERLKSKLGIDNLTVKTFHSLGKHIISQVEEMQPLIDKMAEDPKLRTQFVDQQIQLLLQDDRYKSRLVKYFVRFTYPFKSQYDFKTLHDYNAYISENDMRTLQGEQVKSYEECEIANFLFRQGVAYQYEANYPVNTAGSNYKAYQPDFFLPEYGIYIEHFAVNEKNQTPPFIDQQSYLEGMAWKRALHQTHQTKLIETYSYLKHQGKLTEALSEKLLAAGVHFKPIPTDQLLKQLNQQGRVSEFSELMAQILGLFKTAFLDIKSLVSLAKDHADKERMVAATYLFEPIYEAYQQYLRDAASIDFDDMISRAIDYVESGRYQSPYRYLLVDEFQDISASRARLLKGLLAQQADSSLFCVGDDWQSIYRFAGSDVSITRNFEHYFGDTAISILDKTFRFNNKIGDVAARFITQNPSQLKKQILSHRNVEQPAVSLIKTHQEMFGLHAALEAINRKSAKPASVLLLARFHFKFESLNRAELKRLYPHFTFQALSIHASKGKEADYVVVLGLDKGKNGFPSEKITHPLLELLLPPAETFSFAEERRLFYVALTRARHHVYLITNGNNPSPFVRELLEQQYPILTDEFQGEGFQDNLANTPCPQCETGFMVPRDSQHGSFFACNQYPRCNHTQRACQRCGSRLQTKGKFRVCENRRCDFVEPICPTCGGTLSLRKGRYGEFWGCTNYRKNAAEGCSHTEKSIDLKEARQL